VSSLLLLHGRQAGIYCVCACSCHSPSHLTVQVHFMAASPVFGGPRAQAVTYCRQHCALLPLLVEEQSQRRIKHCSLQIPEEMIFWWDLLEELFGWDDYIQSFGRSLIYTSKQPLHLAGVSPLPSLSPPRVHRLVHWHITLNFSLCSPSDCGHKYQLAHEL